MEYASFYGGRPGNSISIAKTFTGDLNVDENQGIIKQGNDPITVDDLNYGDYFLLNPDNRSLDFYGDIYKVVINGYEKIGNLRGGPGPAPLVNIDNTLNDTIQDVQYEDIFIGGSQNENDKIIIYWKNGMTTNHDGNTLTMNFSIPDTTFNFIPNAVRYNENPNIILDSQNSSVFNKTYNMQIPKGIDGDQITSIELDDENLIFTIKKYEEKDEQWDFYDEIKTVAMIYPTDIQANKTSESEEPLPGDFIITYSDFNSSNENKKGSKSFWIPTIYDINYENGKLIKKYTGITETEDQNQQIIKNFEDQEEILVPDFKWVQNIQITERTNNTEGEQEESSNFTFPLYTFKKTYSTNQEEEMGSFSLPHHIQLNENGQLVMYYQDMNGGTSYEEVPLGNARSYNGILVGTNLTTNYDTYINDENSEKLDVISWLNNSYQNGLTDTNTRGKIVIVGTGGVERYFAFDYLTNGWFELNFASAANQVYKTDQNNTTRYTPSFIVDDYYTIRLSDQIDTNVISRLSNITITITRIRNGENNAFTLNYNLLDISNGILRIVRKGDIIDFQTPNTAYNVTISENNSSQTNDEIALSNGYTINGDITFMVTYDPESEPTPEEPESESNEDNSDD